MQNTEFDDLGVVPGEPERAPEAEVEPFLEALDPSNSEFRIPARPRQDAESAEDEPDEAAQARADAAWERERAAAAERELARERARTAVAEIDGALAEKSEKLKEARAELDVDAEAELLGEITELHVKRAQVEKAFTDRDHYEPRIRPEHRKRADAWVERNAWFSDPKLRYLQAAALEINAEVKKDGYDDATDEYYEELDRRIAERVKVPGRAAGGGGKKVVRLTPDDFRTMRTFGLDPKNPEHLKSFAREKGASD